MAAPNSEGGHDGRPLNEPTPILRAATMAAPLNELTPILKAATMAAPGPGVKPEPLDVGVSFDGSREVLLDVAGRAFQPVPGQPDRHRSWKRNCYATLCMCVVYAKKREWSFTI